MKKIVLISCCKTKLKKLAKAKDLYISPTFKLSLQYARKLQPQEIFVLSAKHGLLDLEKRIKPYNWTLSYVSPKKREKNLIVLTKEQKQIWGKKVIKQLSKKSNLKTDKYIILAGQAYIKPIREELGANKFEEPLKGKSRGERNKLLKSKTRKR